MKDWIIVKIPKLYNLANLEGEALEKAAADLCPNGLHKKVNVDPWSESFYIPLTHVL